MFYLVSSVSALVLISDVLEMISSKLRTTAGDSNSPALIANANDHLSDVHQGEISSL